MCIMVPKYSLNNKYMCTIVHYNTKIKIEVWNIIYKMYIILYYHNIIILVAIFFSFNILYISFIQKQICKYF